MATCNINCHDAITLLDAIKEGWEIKGRRFFNDYALLTVSINGVDTPHTLRLNRNGTWNFQAEVAL